MKKEDVAYDWVDLASLIGGASFLTLLIYGITQL